MKSLAARFALFPLIFLFFSISCESKSKRSSLIKNPKLCSSGEIARVTRVVDGDSIEVIFPNGKEESVRYIGLDTPEYGEKCSDEATERNQALLNNPQIRLIADTNNRDRYGRLVRYVCNSDDVFIDAQLIADGYAEAFRYWPDVQFAEYFSSLEKEAIERGRGCLYR